VTEFQLPCQAELAIDWAKSANQASSLGAVFDLARNESAMVLDDPLLPQQLTVMQWHVKHPSLTWRDRTLFVPMVSKVQPGEPP